MNFIATFPERYAEDFKIVLKMVEDRSIVVCICQTNYIIADLLIPSEWQWHDQR